MRAAPAVRHGRVPVTRDGWPEVEVTASVSAGARCGGLLVLLGLAGCTSFTPGAPRHDAPPPAEFPAEWWPERRQHDLQAIADALPREVWVVDAEGGRRRARVAVSTPCGRGLIQAVRPIDEDGTLTDPQRPPELRFFSVPPGDRPPAEAAGDAALTASGVAYEIEPAGAAPDRGLALIFDDECARAAAAEVAEVLRGRGYATVRLLAPPWAEPSFGAVIRDPADVASVATAVAERFDQQIAERAFAAEAIVRWLDEREPGRSGAPVVLVGFGRGALAMPAAAVLLEERAAAAVFVAAGANALELAFTAEEPDLGIQITGADGPLDDATRRWLLDLYLAGSRLDPYRVAPLLARLPVLVVNGRWDEQVPNPTSFLLWTRLRQPDRLLLPEDHADVLDEVADEAGDLADWIDAALAPR